MSRVLIICGDLPPFPGLPGSGAGLRAYTLGRGLEGRGHRVVWGVPAAAIPAGTQIPAEVSPYVREDLAAFIASVKPEVIIFQSWALVYGLELPELPTVIDLHGPSLLETLYQDSPELKALTVHKVHSLRQADFFTCAGANQRHYWYAWLTLAEHDIRRGVIEVVPMSMPEQMPERRPAEEVELVYGGFYLPWQDPVWGLTKTIDYLERRGRGLLRFFGGRHPFLKSVPAGAYGALEKRLAASPRVAVMGVVSRDELLGHYAKARAALDLMARNPERELAFTTRTVEYLWAGLPVIHQPWSELAGYIGPYGAGWLLEPGDDAALEAALNEIFERPDRAAAKGLAGQRLVAENLTYDRAIGPLDEFIRSPRINRPSSPALSVRIRRRPWSVIAAEAARGTLRQGPAGLWRQIKRRLEAPKT